MNSRASLIALLDSYRPSDPKEEAMRRAMLHFVHQHPDAYLRTCVPGHMTASAWVLTPTHSHALLLHHRKLDKWLQPGGHADGDEDLARVVARELWEETGLEVDPAEGTFFDLDIHDIPARGSDGAHDHYDLRFRFILPLDTPLRQNAESKALRWVPLTDIPALNDHPSILRMVAKSSM